MTGTAMSKAALKAGVLEILRQIEASGEAVIVTDRGRPVVRVEAYYGGEDALISSLRGSVLEYRDPLAPVDQEAWEALR
ncbi:MAG TPA: type II toxin-antitoxin system Phd/YefM family antitoxin [Chloroflexota bacterium]|nr:type II toxin-antitoxin system Phd/YefM family antitoxin [Chloroflexota bacterium]